MNQNTTDNTPPQGCHLLDLKKNAGGRKGNKVHKEVFGVPLDRKMRHEVRLNAKILKKKASGVFLPQNFLC